MTQLYRIVSDIDNTLYFVENNTVYLLKKTIIKSYYDYFQYLVNFGYLSKITMSLEEYLLENL